jgi:hypothetical protein
VKVFVACLLCLPLLLTSCKSNRPVPPEGAAHIRMWTPNPLPVLHDEGITYTKVRDELFDGQDLTKISISLLVREGVTRQNLEALLWKYFREADARRGFKFRPRASDIEIAAYGSEDHLAAESGQWLALLYKTPADSVPRLRVDSVQVAQFDVAPTERFGVNEAQRRVIFRKLMQDQYPDMQPVVNLKPTVDSLVQKFKLSQANLDSIAAEGLAKHWAFPPMQGNR